MVADLGEYRVLADGAPSSSSKKDWYEQVKDSNSSAYAEVSDVLEGAGLNPQSTAEFSNLAVTLTAAAVSYRSQLLPDGSSLPANSTLKYIKLLGPAGSILSFSTQIVISEIDGKSPERAFTEAVVGLVGGSLAGYTLAAVGIGAGSVIIPIIASVAVGAVLLNSYDYYITPEVRQGINPEKGIYEVVTRLDLADYMERYWDGYYGDSRLAERDEWILSSKETDLTIEYVNGKAENLYTFDQNQVPEAVFYQILKHSSDNFKVEWLDSKTDTVQNFYNKTEQLLRVKAKSSNEALYALLSLRPFVLLTEQQDNYQNLNRDDYSDQFIRDRANFLYHIAHPDALVFDNDIYFHDFELEIKGEAGNGSPSVTTDRYLWGTEQSDTLEGGLLYAKDHLYGMGGDDHLYGGMGDDYLEGGKGSDQMFGGAGDDIFAVIGDAAAYDVFDGGSGNDKIVGGALDDTLRVHEFVDHNIEVIDGKGGTNTIVGTDGNDVFNFSEVEIKHIESIDMAGGDDTLIINDIAELSDVTTIDGGSGSGDILQGSDEGDTFDLDELDVIGFEKLDTGAGGDIVTLGENSSFSKINLGSENDTITVNSLTGITLLDGGSGTDTLQGDEQNNTIDLSSADVKFMEEIDGGAGDDTITLGQLQAGALDEVRGGDGNDDITGSDEGDTIRGDAGDDMLYGEAGVDSLSGGTGDDLLEGGTGADELHGDAGSDHLDGGDGDDDLYGGTGNDSLLGVLATTCSMVKVAKTICMAEIMTTCWKVGLNPMSFTVTQVQITLTVVMVTTTFMAVLVMIAF